MEVPDEVEPVVNETKEEEKDVAAVAEAGYKEFTDVDLGFSSPQSMKARARYGGSKTPGPLILPKT